MAQRKGRFFPYGIHVRGRKSLSKTQPIQTIPEQDELLIPLSQHIGAPAKAIVNVGDKVKKGQMIAEAGGFISAPVYSGINGEVTEILTLPNVMGAPVTHIRVKNDYSTEELTLPPMEDKDDKQAIIERIRLAGIVGLGGAGFPTAVKLSPKESVDTLIINAAECEPYLTCDYRLMIERTDDVVKGIRYFQKALGVKNVIIGIEANKPDVIEIFDKFDDMEVVVLKKQYPMGSEKHLIYCCTGRKVGLGALPSSVGCVVQNVKTAIATYEAIELNKPLYEGVITVSGKGVKNPTNVKAPYGTSYKTLIDFCGGTSDDVAKYVAGGPMMGKAAINLDLYTKKTDSGLLALTTAEVSASQPTNCINCGKCSKNCPMRLTPTLMEFYILGEDYLKAEKLGVMNCIECGSCAYNCPAKRALTQSFSFAKGKIKEIHAKENNK